MYLYETDLRCINLERADLVDTYLSRTDFTEANLRAENLAGSLLRYAMFCNTALRDGSINNSS